MTLGEKIRDCRHEMHLTQQALAEGIVTRNMLSQIENGTAQPSLDTLIAFASRLDVPVGRLLGEENDPFLFRKAAMMPHLFKLMREGKYAECLSRAELLFGDRDDDETAFFRCENACRAAEAELLSGALTQAKIHAAQVPAYAGRTLYKTDHLTAVATLLSAVAENPQAPRLELDEDAYHKTADAAVNSDLFHYLCDDVGYRYQNEVMGRHMEAKKLMLDDRYTAARAILESLETEKLSLKIGTYILFKIYGDLESCTRNQSDFEAAYKMSVKRMALFSVFKS